MFHFSGDGLIQHRELQHVMRACMEENGMKFSENQVNLRSSYSIIRKQYRNSMRDL